MSFDVTYYQDGDFVELVFKGEIPLEVLEQSRLKVDQILRDNDCKKLLVNITTGEPKTSVHEDYQFTRDLHSFFPLGTKIAILHSTTQDANLDFIENVARNRSIDLFHFSEKSLALEWLNEQEHGD